MRHIEADRVKITASISATNVGERGKGDERTTDAKQNSCIRKVNNL
jgi:hypothetical protein